MAVPLQLKGLRLSQGVIQSPLAACTDLAFRLVARRRGMEFAFLEMVSAHALVQRNAKTLEMLKTLPEDRPLGAQLVGCDPGVLGEAAAAIEELGFDLLDLNFGCPVPKVTGGGEGAGSAMLRQPEKAEAIFARVARSVRRIPVTVKMRKGYSDPSGREAVAIAKRAEACGLSAVTVHGRTREQRYDGKADYEAIGRVKAAVSIPVIGNGDVLAAPDARRLRAVSGCDGVMIGRGGMGNPWIYRNVAEGLADPDRVPFAPTLGQRRDALLEHLALELEHESDWHAVVTLRRVACWYAAGIPGGAEFRSRVCRAPTGAAMREMIEEFFDAAGASAAYPLPQPVAQVPG
ncbi:MAG: tRNA dihydrouridine synthase DusB [Elusimicrobia bacterium]|nr:tRNA dihydrouridine synthase DusB [Elusimicrobiota bacterium]